MSAVAQHPIRLAEELILRLLDERSGYLEAIPADLDLRMEAPPWNVHRGRVARFAGPTLEVRAR